MPSTGSRVRQPRTKASAGCTRMVSMTPSLSARWSTTARSQSLIEAKTASMPSTAVSQVRLVNNATRRTVPGVVAVLAKSGSGQYE